MTTRRRLDSLAGAAVYVALLAIAARLGYCLACACAGVNP